MPEVDLDTHITDVTNLLHYEDLHDVVLVGHSYGGLVITGVADRMPDRVRHLVYVDSGPLPDGATNADFSGPTSAPATRLLWPPATGGACRRRRGPSWHPMWMESIPTR